VIMSNINQFLTDLSGKVVSPIKAINAHRGRNHDGGRGTSYSGERRNKMKHTREDTERNVLADAAAKNAKTTTEHMLDTLRYWDVVMPPIKKYMHNNHLIPSVRNAFSEVTLGTFNKKRRITIELYKPETKKKNPYSLSTPTGSLDGAGEMYDDDDGGGTPGRKHRYFGPLLRGVSTANLPSDIIVDNNKKFKGGADNVKSNDSDANDDLDGSDDIKLDFPPLGDEDIVIFRILRVSHKKGGSSFDSDDDDLPEGDFDAHSIGDFSYDDYGDGRADADKFDLRWRERYRSKINEMEILKLYGRTVEVQMGVAEDLVVRDLCFKSKEDANTFVKVFKEMRKLQRERGMRMIASHQRDLEIGQFTSSKDGNGGGIRSRGIDFGMDSDDDDNKLSVRTKKSQRRDCCSCMSKRGPKFPSQINLLVEIVSATDLPIADVYSSDPYVLVRDSQIEWHKTRVIQKSLNPVWCLSTGSLFLIKTTLFNFFESSNTVDFIVKDYDTIGEDEILGRVIIPKTEMLSGTGERHDYELTAHAGKHGVQYKGKKAYLALRFRLASEDDLAFMAEFDKHNRNRAMIVSSINSYPIKDGVFAKDAFLPPQVHPNPPLKRNKRPTMDGRSTQYRVKPFPDPERPEKETKWMTEREIEDMAMKPSRNWIEAGSGSVCKLYVEILGLNDIPNLDFSVTGRDKSDPFVTIAYEDVVVNTDVINDCLSPRWLPWTQRAFILNTMHPSSQLMIGVFDHDQGVSGQTNHDKIGRCVLNLTNARPNTVYTLKCHLYDTDEPDRKVRGTILIRARMETTDQRKALLHAFQLHTEYSVSFKKRPDYKCAYYALTNDTAHQTLSLTTITKYATELQGYAGILDEVVDAMLTVFLWRGHYPVPIRFPFCRPCIVKLPLHSITAFVWGMVLAHDFEMIFSFLCFWVAWVLLATMGHRQTHPSPWKQPRSYWELLCVLIFNASPPAQTIEPNHNIEAIMAFDAYQFELEKLRNEAIEHARQDKEMQQSKLENQQEKMEKETMAGGEKLNIGMTQFALAPFKSVLMPAQTNLYRTCLSLRIASSIIMWRDSIAAFWIVTAALIASFIVAWIPWAFIFRWAFKIFVYVALGPWMKLVDVCYVSKRQNMTRAERQAQTEADFQRRYDLLLGQSYLRRLINESDQKMKDMKRYMFGKVRHRKRMLWSAECFTRPRTIF
jgi:C2 domain